MSWDKRIDSPISERFHVLAAFQDQAVFDRETGLVWERSPSTQPMPWSSARLFCARKAVGGRGGWRLPAFYELASLVDPSVHTGPRLPAGHPFQNVQAAAYWSDTAFANELGFVLIVDFQFLPATQQEIDVNDANLGGVDK